MNSVADIEPHVDPTDFAAAARTEALRTRALLNAAR